MSYRTVAGPRMAGMADNELVSTATREHTLLIFKNGGSVMLTRWQPWGDVSTEMNRLHDEMNRLFDRWGTNGPRMIARGVQPLLNM